MTSLLRFGLLAAFLAVVGCADNAPSETADSDSTPTGNAPAPSEAPAPDADSSVAAGESASDDALMPGSPVPEIHIAKWMKGDAVESFDKGQVYVVEFWATWCPPCIASMPHMASLQTEYGDKVQFIGVTAEDEATVEKFFGQDSPEGKSWSDTLTYRIALDDERKTNAAFLEAANQNGIPCAFIVGGSGNVEWIGHPMEMDEPLEMIVDGTWDSKGARENFLKEIAFEKEMMAIQPKLATAQQNGDFKQGVALCDELIGKYPDMGYLVGIKMQFLLQGEMTEELNATAKHVVSTMGDDPMMLQAVASMLTLGTQDEKRDLDVALEAASKAVELTEEQEVPPLDALARVHFEKGDVEQAIAWQKKAVALGPDMESLKKDLEKYEAALTEKDDE